MDKDEKKAFGFGVLSGVTGNAIWQLIGGLLFSSAVLGFIPAWFHGLNDFQQAILYTLSAVALILAGAFAISRYLRTRKRAATDAPKLTAAANPDLITARELDRVRVVLRELPASAGSLLCTLAYDGPQSVPMSDLTVLNLIHANIVESRGNSKLGEWVIALRPELKDLMIEHFAGERKP